MNVNFMRSCNITNITERERQTLDADECQSMQKRLLRVPIVTFCGPQVDSCSHSPYHRIVADGELQLYLVRSHCWLLQETSICRDLQRSDAILSAGWVCQDSATCTELLDAARNAKHGLYHGSSRFLVIASIRRHLCQLPKKVLRGQLAGLRSRSNGH